MISNLFQVVSKNKEYHLKFLKDLVSADSSNEKHGVYGKEINVQRIIMEKLKEMGLELDVFEPDNELLKKYKEADEGHEYSDRPNVIGIYKGTGGGKSLILNGHIDTMPYDRLDEWICHPIAPVVKDGKLYGRGTTDMKAGVAAMILALETIISMGVKLKGDVIIETVVDEEGGGNGSLACVDRGYKADAAIITEPTMLEIMPAHMGWLFYRIELRGKALHSALKWKGVNAIEKAVKVIQALQELERNWAIAKRHAILPPPTINIGTIHGGMAGSVVADSCIIDFGLHYLPTDSDNEGLGSDVEKELMEVIQNVIDGDSWLKHNPPSIVKYQEGSAYEINPNHPLVGIISDNFKQLTGEQPIIRGCEYGSDARILNNYGKTPSVIFGPGSIEQAHSINEFVSIEQFYMSIHILAKTIIEWCGVSQDNSKHN